jgi:hypothetical protein
MTVERPEIVSGMLILRIAVCDAVILGIAAGAAWLLGWWNVAGFGRSLLLAGGAAVVCGGVAAFVQLLLARASRTVAATTDRGDGFLSVLAHALSGEDPALQILSIVFGSGVLWAIAGALLAFAG